MTVIRNNTARSICSKPASNPTSDTESLHLGSASASDTESINNEPAYHPLRPRYLPNNFMSGSEDSGSKMSWGKKKLRRFQNRCILQTLSEEEELENALVVMDVYQTPFARLLEDPNALLYWNAFIEKSEEEQENILTVFSQSYSKHDSKNLKEVPKVDQGKISWRVKRTLKEKMKKNLTIEEVKTSEDDILDFFAATPAEIYVKHPANSFDRLLVKAIAHYHGLTINNPDPTLETHLKPPVKISNTLDNWTPAKCFLTDFVTQLR